MAWSEESFTPKKIIEQDLGGEFSPEYLMAVREKMAIAKKTQTDPHWEDIKIEELTDDDIKLWDEFEKDILMQGQFTNYYQRVKANATTSQLNLFAMIRNKFIEHQARDIIAEKHGHRDDEFHLAA